MHGHAWHHQIHVVIEVVVVCETGDATIPITVRCMLATIVRVAIAVRTTQPAIQIVVIVVLIIAITAITVVSLEAIRYAILL